jgi:hypothetical protein
VKFDARECGLLRGDERAEDGRRSASGSSSGLGITLVTGAVRQAAGSQTLPDRLGVGNRRADGGRLLLSGPIGQQKGVWRMGIPVRWAAYDCADYFDGDWTEDSHFDVLSQTFVVVPVAEAYENAAMGFFAVGRSGCDGIDFGFRRTLDCGCFTRSIVNGATWPRRSPNWRRAGVPAG